MKTYGYARVSSADQNAARQLDALEKIGIVRADIFVDHKSGRDFDRPAWQRLVARVRRGDLIVVTSLDLSADEEPGGLLRSRLGYRQPAHDGAGIVLSRAAPARLGYTIVDAARRKPAFSPLPRL